MIKFKLKSKCKVTVTNVNFLKQILTSNVILGALSGFHRNVAKGGSYQFVSSESKWFLFHFIFGSFISFPFNRVVPPSNVKELHVVQDK